MSCDRNGCTNIHSDYYFNEIGYVCGGCLTEFKQKFVSSNKMNVEKFLTKFMLTEKPSWNDTEIKEKSLTNFLEAHGYTN